MHQVVSAVSFRATPMTDPLGLRLEGTVDPSTHQRLSAAFSTLDRYDQRVCLDVQGLEFIDLAGLRMIVAFARGRAARGAVDLVGLDPYLVRVLALLDWDHAPGLHLGTPRR